MLKEEFAQALRQKLSQIPLETRRTWNETDLFGWYMKATREDSYLRWERCPGGNPWHWVPGFCENYYGSNAL
ncbi:hypothetical protein ACJ8I6_09450 [Serratia sp. CY37646]|uniref:hypothetical protein n=1 Tax=Serratia sp. CY37646 TaxID=3383611 RepID=UPI003F9F8202